MEMWFSELHTSNVKLSMRIEKQLFSGNSDCQRIDVLESVEFGKFLALDGDILFSEADEFIYNEINIHPTDRKIKMVHLPNQQAAGVFNSWQNKTDKTEY